MFFADENECEEGRQADKDKARLLMKSLLKEIASKCKGEGVAETRCIAVPAVIERVICSSLMLSLTKIQQSFVLYDICTIYFQVVGSQYLCVFSLVEGLGTYYSLCLSIYIVSVWYFGRVNPHLPNLPILHASNNFLQLSGMLCSQPF